MFELLYDFDVMAPRKFLITRYSDEKKITLSKRGFEKRTFNDFRHV
jgi:hypothetical protein